MSARLTPNQKDRLLRLGRAATVLSNGRPGRWVRDKDCGGPAALAHLFDKGFVMRDIRVGPLGGEHVFYRPNEAGWAAIDKARVLAKTEREQSLVEIDDRILAARRSQSVVRVFTGIDEYRGVPGEVERVEVWDASVVMLNIGQRQVPLMAITKVVDG